MQKMTGENYPEQARMSQSSRLIENDVNEITMTELSTIEAEEVPVPVKPACSGRA